MSSNSPEIPIRKINSPFSKSTIQFFQTQSTIYQFINQFFLPKKHDYSEKILQFYSNTYNFTQKNHKILNSEGQLLHATVFHKSGLEKPPQNCIIYCHGFGSTKLEAVHILKVLTKQISLCCFDFSGSGKSQGSITTYGAKEKEDIHSVLTYLRQKLSFKQFVLWGRSMGATACLLYSIKYEKTKQIQNQNVIFQIVDSPYVSFQKISLELAKKFISMPYFGTNIILDVMKKHCNTLEEYNPFCVNLDKVSECKIPTLFIYSQNDEIVNCQNSQELCSKFTAFYEKIIISQNHNAPRTVQTLSEIIKKIEIQIKNCDITKKKGIVFRSFISNKSNDIKSKKKGIERFLNKKNCSSTIYDFSKPSSVHRITEYGIMNQKKCHQSNFHSTDTIFNHEKIFQDVKYFARQQISISTLPHQLDSKNYKSSFDKMPLQKLRTNQLQSLVSSPDHKKQNLQNVYQIRKPQVQKNMKGKQLKKYFSPLKSADIQSPLTNFSREQIIYENSKKKNRYREGQRRAFSASNKLNISLSKLKNLKDKNLIYEKKQRQDDQKKKKLNYVKEKVQKVIESSPYISTSLKSMIRPISLCKKIQPIKPILKTNTPTTKTQTISSSIQKFHFLGFLKSPSRVSESKQKQGTIFRKEKSHLRQENSTRGMQVNKIRSSQIIYLDKNFYKYGF